MGLFDNGIGGFVSGIFGSTNKEKAKGYNVDSNAYQYGGDPMGAENAATGYQAQGQAAQNRLAPQAQNVSINYGQADVDRAQGQQARRGQNTIANIMAQRAQGLAGPSIAQQQADRQMGQSMAQQAAMAGSARGAGGLAAARRNAAFNNANAAADISGQAQIAGAQERRDDTNAAAGMYGALRGGDLASQGQVAGQAQASAQLGAQQNQFNAGLRDSAANRNDQMTMGYEGLAQGTRLAQLGAGQNEQAQRSANALGAQGINAGVGGQNASMNQANGMNVLGMAQSAAGVGAGAIAGKAKGGPIGGAKPYLVGEQGPELVVPRHDGYVLTAEQTRQALGNSPASTINNLFNRGNTEARNVSFASIMGARACGGDVRGMRALGGPVDGLPNERGPVNRPMLGPEPAPAPVPGYGGPTDFRGFDPNALDALQSQIDAQQLESRKNTYAARQDVANIDEADKNAIWNADYKDRHGQQLSKEEMNAEAEARYRQDLDKKDARDKSKAARKRSVADILGDMGKSEQQAAAGVDTAYHGGGGHYVPPQLIPISGARAMGGPMVAGGLVPLGPHLGGGGGVGGGTEYGGGGIDHNMLLKAGTGLASPQAVPGMVGGGGITGGASMGGAAIPGFGGAREDGGPVEGDGSKSYDTKLTPEEEKAFVAWKQQYAPNDSGEDYDYRGAFKAGEKPGNDGHWVDTFKKPNHPTFSDQSQYARGADAAKAGRWDGETYVPAAKPKKVYVYDASKPFGDRFQPAPERQMTSFTRTDPETELAKASIQKAVEDPRTAAQNVAISPGAMALNYSQDAVRSLAPPKPGAPDTETIQKAAVQSLLGGAGVGAPTAAAGIAHLINNYFARRGK